MSQFIFGNFFATELTNGVSTASLTLTVPPSASLKLPAIAVGEDKLAMLTLWDGQLPPEIVACTLNQQNGNLTVLRAQEGTTAQAWAAGTQVISSLTAGVINAALAAYFDITAILNSNFLKLTGGTLTGVLNLSADPVGPSEAANKHYVDSVQGDKLPLAGGTMTGWLNMNTQRIIQLPAPVTGTEPATKSYADGLITTVNNVIADHTGAIESGGSASAYLVTPAASYPALTHGMSFTFAPHVANAAGATMNYAGLGAKPILAGGPIPAGFFPQRYPVTLVYLVWFDSWFVTNVHQTTLDFSAGDLKYSVKTIDHGRWYLADGRAVPRTGDTAALFAETGTAFGVGDNVTTFNIIDCRGRVIAGLDNMTGVSANRLSTVIPASNTRGATGGQQQIPSLSISQVPTITPAGVVTTPSGTIGTITPSGTNTAPAITVTDTRTWQGSKGGSNAAVLGATDAIQQPSGTNTTITIPVSIISGAIGAVLNSAPVFTGDPVTPVFTGAAVTFTGTSFGAGTAVPTTQPTIMANIFVRY